MFKAFIFVFGGTAVIYYWSFGGHGYFKLPQIVDVKAQYKIKKIENENIKLKLHVRELEFSLARLQEASKKTPEMDRSVASVSSSKKFELFPQGKKIEDFVKQDIYHWSTGKLSALAEKEYYLKNYLASAQYGLTLLNHMDDKSIADEKFYYQLGISCVESKFYVHEGGEVLNNLITKYPESPLIIQAKLWRGLAFHRLNNKKEFLAMMEEFKTKYRNTKEWTVLKNIYERSIASGKDNFNLKDNDKDQKKIQEGSHE